MGNQPEAGSPHRRRGRTATGALDPDEHAWLRVRRYGVPPGMIEECARRREAGDWRGACAAGLIRVAFGLRGVAKRFGVEATERIEADLRSLAPDLLRWYLPRSAENSTALVPMQRFALSTLDGRVPLDMPVLAARMPHSTSAAQWITLEVAPLAEVPFDLAPVFWSAAHIGELRRWYGGGDARLPGFDAGGTALPDSRWASEVDSADPASRTEVGWRLIAAGDRAGAWRLHGVELRLADGDDAKLPDNPVGLVTEVRRLATRYAVTTFSKRDWPTSLILDTSDPQRITGHLVSWSLGGEQRQIPNSLHRRPVELELVRRGLLTPDELHPLVRTALFGAGRDGVAGPTYQPSTLEPVRVRCRGAWHQVTQRDGALRLLDHTPDEVRREATLRGLGGASAGCFVVQQHWTTGSGWLPKALRAQRRHLILHAMHGNTPAVLGLLDAGADPSARGIQGRALLHHLATLDYVVLLPRLLAAGLDIDTRDSDGRTALMYAVFAHQPDLARALLTAGASPAITDSTGATALRHASNLLHHERTRHRGSLVPLLRATEQLLKDATA